MKIWKRVAFRQIVGVTDASLRAHHLIPQSLWNNPVIQKAASSTHIPYHIHHPKNGKGISAPIHNAPHLDYNAAVNNKLGLTGSSPNSVYEKIEDLHGSLQLAPDHLVVEEVVGFQSWLNNLLEANPNTPLNDLVPQINAYIP